MRRDETLADYLKTQGISRRGFLKFCAATASMMALPLGAADAIAKALSEARRPLSGYHFRNVPVVPNL